ncbi:DUF3805 domain-containing protein [Mucilaginibacter sp. HD30]
MHIKTCNLQNGWFSVMLPDDWDEYDDGEEGTFCFFNTAKWNGNLRITPFHWLGTVIVDESKAEKYIEDEVRENEGAIRIKIGNFDCAFYKKDLIEDGEKLVIYYWITGKDNDIFICSFTTNKELENSIDLNQLQDVIKSIV